MRISKNVCVDESMENMRNNSFEANQSDWVVKIGNYVLATYLSLQMILVKIKIRIDNLVYVGCSSDIIPIHLNKGHKLFMDNYFSASICTFSLKTILRYWNDKIKSSRALSSSKKKLL